MNQTSTKQHKNTKFRFFKKNDETKLATSSEILCKDRCDELEAKMFYMDSDDIDKYDKKGTREYMACLDSFVKNVNPDKKFYLRQLPILREMADKEPRFFLEEVIEIASLLWRRSSNSCKEQPEILRKYEETVLACSPDEIPKLVTLTEVKHLFDDCDINKGLVTITPDIAFSKLNDCSRGYVEQLYIKDCRGKQFIYPALAVRMIFNNCVLGLNWTTNTCNKHVNCMEKCRKRAIELMKKYTSSSMNLIPFGTIQMEIEKLKREECYFDHQVSFRFELNYLCLDMPNDELIPLGLYKTAINRFHLPTNEPLAELHRAPVQGIRLSILLGFIIQFIGPIDKDNELLAHVLISILEFSIAKDIEKAVAFMRKEVIVRGKDGTRKIFEPYEAQEDNQSKYEKMAEKARLRKLAVQQKKNKKGGKQKSAKESEENDEAPDSQWKDLSNEPIELEEFMSIEDIRHSIVTIKGGRYGSNYSLLRDGPRKENPQKFFIIDINEWQKLVDMGSMMGFEWTKDEKYLEDLESFVKLTGIKKFVLRCPQNYIEGSKRFLLIEEALEIARSSLALNGPDPKLNGMLDALDAEVQTLNGIVCKLRNMVEIDALFYIHRIDKSTITVIPDFVEKLSEQFNSKENIYPPVTTIGRKGEELMNMGESALYIFQNVICGINWIEAIKTHGIDVYDNFRDTFEGTLKPLFCEWMTCYVARDCHDEVITKLKKHKIFENQPQADLNFFDGFPKGSLVPTSYFSDQCEANGLPPMPYSFVYSLDAMLLNEAKVLMMIVWMCQFYPHYERSRQQGDTAMQREFIRNTILARLPREAKFYKTLATLIAYWSDNAPVRATMSPEPVKPARMQSQEESDEETSRRILRARDAPQMLSLDKSGTALKDTTVEPSSSSQSLHEDAENSSVKTPKSTKPQERSTKKTKSKTSAISKESARSPSTSTSEPCFSQKPIPENREKNQRLLDEEAVNSSEKTSKPKKTQKEPLEKTEMSQAPKKEVKDNSKESFSKQPRDISVPSKSEALGSSTARQVESKTSAISKDSSRSSSTSFSEQNSSQKHIPENREKNHGSLDERAVEKKKFEDQQRKMMKMQNQMKELKDQLKQLSEENQTLKSSIEERKEEDSNKLRKVKKELEKEREKTAKLEQAIKDWKLSLEFMEKDLMEAGEQMDVANEKLRKADENLKEQTAKSRNLENQLREANTSLAAMNKEKDRAVERVVREWTERWNVERHQVQLAQNRTVEAESKARQLMKENVKLLEKKSGDGSHLPAHVATYKEDIRKLRQLLKEKDDLIPHLQKRIQELSNQPGPSSQTSEDPNEYLERIRNMLEIVNRDDSIEEKRVRISRLLTNTDSADTRSLCVLEEDLFDASVTMYRDTLNYIMFKVKQTQSTEGCQPVPSYPDLSQRFLDAENKERMKPMFGEGDCAICFEKIEKHDEERKCPNEICALSYHGKCILKSIETMPSCPYCKTPYYNVDDFPVLS